MDDSEKTKHESVFPTYLPTNLSLALSIPSTFFFPLSLFSKWPLQSHPSHPIPPPPSFLSFCLSKTEVVWWALTTETAKSTSLSSTGFNYSTAKRLNPVSNDFDQEARWHQTDFPHWIKSWIINIDTGNSPRNTSRSENGEVALSANHLREHHGKACPGLHGPPRS